MATIQRDEIGTLDINLIQGDSKTVSLKFEVINLDEEQVPIDLRDFTAIRLDVKSKRDVNERPFISFTVGNGLIIAGEYFNVLQFTFSNQFLATAQTIWYYDIKFTDLSIVKHLVEGVINIKRIGTK